MNFISLKRLFYFRGSRSNLPKKVDACVSIQICGQSGSLMRSKLQHLANSNVGFHYFLK